MRLDIPATLQLLIIFSLVVIAVGRKVHLGLAAALGGIALALWHGLRFTAISGIVIGETLNPDTLLLLALMVCIMSFSAAMKKSGAMETLARAIGTVTSSPRIAMAITPLLIGTLPMPGGAILSAPLVEAIDIDHKEKAGTLSATNYWFRHSLELLWPLYPAFILTTSLSGISVLRLMLLNSYSLPVIFTLGCVFVLPAAPRRSSHTSSSAIDRGSPLSRTARFIKGIAPLAIVIFSYIFFDVLWRFISPGIDLAGSSKALVGRYLPILLGLALGSLSLGYRAKGFGSFRDSVSMATMRLIAMILGIRIFSALIGEIGLAGAAAAELTEAGIPPLVAVAVIPFIAGLVTGIGFGYVGLAIPIILGLVPEGSAFPREAAVVLAGAFGFAGMMISPLHVCMVVSAEHFKAGLPATIRRFALPLGIFLVIAVLYAIMLAGILG